MRREFTVIGMLASGGLIVASNVVAFIGRQHEGLGVAEILHYSLPLTLYLFANFCMDLGRARERAERERADQRRLPG